ncbi:MAG: aminopeptidase N [Bacteriovoracaceae bacterium]
MTSTPKTIYEKDYKQPDYFFESIDLYFSIFDDKTIVTAKSKLVKNPKATTNVIFLNGDNLKLLTLRMNGQDLKESHYKKEVEGLTIMNALEKVELEIVTEIYPHQNTALEGLYQSGNMFCTQNEPEGFRKITYYIDRPDNMAKFTTTIEADKKKYPFLLSNGNDVARKDLGSRHMVKWEDPFKKPSYLFALVAGDFDLLEDNYVTMSGRIVKLQIFVDKGDLDKTAHAMESLKKSMKWDEDTFGLEYDLDIYMIVAVSSFNMGAMENKGLNVFNSAYVLANPKTATDTDFENIEGVIGHEYFHNWTGNRVTCRDWFQLTLKEGLTVFRDQEFSADMNSRGVKRINDIIQLRNRQFPEDAGPMAHPIKPPAYIEINNFYTPTVYEKGAEVIRMIESLIGKENFKKGMKKYFELFDGQAVTTEDFVKSMEMASGKDLTQFKRWYHQAGTPVISVKETFDEKNSTYNLNFEQSCPATAESREKLPFHMPLSLALFTTDGIMLQESLIEMTEKTKEVSFKNMLTKPILSFNRNYSAPVRVNFEQNEKELLKLYAFDTDSFNRYEAGQKVMQKIIYETMNSGSVNANDFTQAFAAVLNDQKIDCAFKAELLKITAESELNDLMPTPDYDGVHSAREALHLTLAKALKQDLLNCYNSFNNDLYDGSAKGIGRRALKNQCLHFLSYLPQEEMKNTYQTQFENADNMTDQLSVLKILCNTTLPYKEIALQSFFTQWKHERLVVDKWFAVQATSKLPGALATVEALMNHPEFSIKVPNRFRSVVYNFAIGNPFHFHKSDGSGYKFIADRVIEIDALNPQVSARLVNYSFNVIKRLDSSRKKLAQQELRRVLSSGNLSKDTFEIVSKNLGE